MNIRAKILVIVLLIGLNLIFAGCEEGSYNTLYYSFYYAGYDTRDLKFYLISTLASYNFPLKDIYQDYISTDYRYRYFEGFGEEPSFYIRDWCIIWFVYEIYTGTRVEIRFSLQYGFTRSDYGRFYKFPKVPLVLKREYDEIIENIKILMDGQIYGFEPNY